MCRYCNNIGFRNSEIHLFNNDDDDGRETLQIVRSHEWKDHAFLIYGDIILSDPIKAIEHTYQKEIKFCPMCGAWLGSEYEKC